MKALDRNEQSCKQSVRLSHAGNRDVPADYAGIRRLNSVYLGLDILRCIHTTVSSTYVFYTCILRTVQCMYNAVDEETICTMQLTKKSLMLSISGPHEIVRMHVENFFEVQTCQIVPDLFNTTSRPQRRMHPKLLQPPH